MSPRRAPIAVPCSKNLRCSDDLARERPHGFAGVNPLRVRMHEPRRAHAPACHALSMNPSITLAASMAVTPPGS
jgi:hypothetical protein